MQFILKKKNITFLNPILDWLLYMAGYTIVFLAVTCLFDSIVVDKNHFILWAIIIELLIYLLNKTVKPILFTLTIPITGVTLGLFYPCINVFILKLADWLLGKHFEINHIIVAFFAAILISVMNFLMEKIIEKIIRKVKPKNESNAH